MSVVYMWEWDNAKDETRYRKYVELTGFRKGYAEKYKGFIDIMDKLIQEGGLKHSSWGDNTGHVIAHWEFDGIESFARLWSVDEWHKYMVELNPLVDNYKTRLLRQALMITEDLIA